MATITTAPGSLYSSGSLAIYVEKVAVAQFVKSTFFYDMGEQRSLPKGMHTYTFNKVDATSAIGSALTEGTTPAETSFSMSQVAITPAQYGHRVVISDVALRDSPVDTFRTAAVELGRVLAEKVDLVIQDSIDGLTTINQDVIYAGTNTARNTIAATDTLTAAKLAEAFARLKSRAAPMIGNHYVAVVHPLVAHDLRIQAPSAGYTFLSINQYTSREGLFNGEIGMIAGVRIVESPNVQVYADTGAGATVDVYPTYVMGEKAYGLVKTDGVQSYVVAPTASDSDPLAQRGHVSCKIRFGAAILKSEALIRIESASSLGANT